ncbi:carbohydrate ABC transporter permease [Saccharothrix australiensis]|uniref:Cellobiose transport system permease protein n=1 Tax=Saccharothrix australiensis TaxID=2072 RepID=A0A495W1J4_9PSEU|nr:carbohydrate ABC transporter permease [Saccharothrix australiensis]RKT55339.1 cellobiose transport system permease protein [Saccharothrix australiensis]
MRRAPGALAGPALLLVLVASLFPLYWSVVVASHDGASTSTGALPLLPGGELVDHVRAVFEAVDFRAALANSAIVAVTVTASNVLLSTLAGFAFAHLRFRGRRALLGLVVGSVMVPAQLGVVPLFELMGWLGWYGDLAAVVAPGLVSAFGVFWMRQACREAVPRELVDAARVDGCSSVRIWWHVVLPAVRPQAVVLAMLTFLAAWNDFFWPLVVLDPVESPTVQVALSHLAGGYYTDYPLVLTGAVLGTAPVVVLFALPARRLIAGLRRVPVDR